MRNAPFFALLMGDARGYDEWAQRIAAGDWIGRDVFYQAPLYPYFLASIYWIAGRSPALVRIAQAVIGSCSCVLIAAAARRLFSARAGLVAGLMLAVYAPAIFFDGLLQKSVLDVFFVCLALWLTANITAEQRSRQLMPWRWLALGLGLGGLSLTRENALVFIAVILGWAILRFGVRAAAVFTLGAAIVMLPVAARNSMVGGGFYVTTSQFGTNFFIGNHRGADGTYQSLRYGRGAPEYERQDAAELAESELHRKLTPREVSRFWTARTLAFIVSEPGAWLKLMARKTALLVNATEMVDTEDQESYAEWSAVLRLLGPVTHFGVLVPLAFAGMLATWSGRSRLWVLYALLIVYALSVMFFFVFARYRYPLVPMLTLFAAAGGLAAIAEIQSFQRAGFFLVRPASRKLILQVTAVATVAIFVNWPMGSASAMRAVTATNAGIALALSGRVVEALHEFRQAIDLDSGSAKAYWNLGNTLASEDHWAEAIAALRRAAELDPTDAAVRYDLASALLESGNPKEAVTEFRTTLRLSPTMVEAHNNLGIALGSQGSLDEAIDEFRRALAIQPGFADAQQNLRLALAARDARRK